MHQGSEHANSRGRSLLIAGLMGSGGLLSLGCQSQESYQLWVGTRLAGQVSTFPARIPEVLFIPSCTIGPDPFSDLCGLPILLTPLSRLRSPSLLARNSTACHLGCRGPGAGHGIHFLIKDRKLRHTAWPHLVVPRPQAVELGATLLWRAQKALLPQLFCHRPVGLAVLTSLEFLMMLTIQEDGQERLGLVVAPLHTCCQGPRDTQ